MTKAERKRALDKADKQVADARRELLASQAQGVDLTGVGKLLASVGMDLQELLAANTRQKRLALAGPVKAALGLPSDPQAAIAKFFEVYLRVGVAELEIDALARMTAPEPGQPGPFGGN